MVKEVQRRPICFLAALLAASIPTPAQERPIVVRAGTGLDG